MFGRLLAAGLVAGSVWLAAGTAAAELRGRGPRVDVSLHRAPIADVLRFFGEAAGINIVSGEELDGEVTITLRDVPWEMALRVTLLTVGLEMEWVGEVVLVASAETLAARREARITERRRCFETSPPRTTVIRLSHARAADMLPLVQATLTDRGRAVVDERTNTIIVSDVDCPE